MNFFKRRLAVYCIFLSCIITGGLCDFKQISVIRYYNVNEFFIQKHGSQSESLEQMYASIPNESWTSWQESYCEKLVRRNEYFSVKQEELFEISNSNVQDLRTFYRQEIFRYHFKKQTHRPLNSDNYHKMFKFFIVKLTVGNKRITELAMACVVRKTRTGELKQYFISRAYSTFRFLIGHDQNEKLIVLAIITEWILRIPSIQEVSAVDKDGAETRLNPELNPTCKMSIMEQIQACQVFLQVDHVRRSRYFHSIKFWPTRFNVQSCKNKIIRKYCPRTQRLLKQYEDLVVRCKYRDPNGGILNYHFSRMAPHYPNFYFVFESDDEIYLKSKVMLIDY